MIVYSHQKMADKALASEPIAYGRIRYKRIAECELILSPTQLKSVYSWMGAKLEEYEALFGKIPTSQELQSRLKTYQESKSSVKGSSTQNKPSSYQ